MKLVTYRTAAGAAPTAGYLDGDVVHPLTEPGTPGTPGTPGSPGSPGASLLQLIGAGDVASRRPVGDAVPADPVQLLAPVGRGAAPPEKIIAIGMNYRDHAAEIGIDVPTTPVVFTKYANTVVGPGQTVRIPDITTQVDYEAELAVVIGRTANRVSAQDALDHVLGYACCNDVSARDLQFSEGGQWSHSKSLDTFLPLGPWIVTTEEIPDPQDLSIRCSVNGSTVQDGHTSKMVFSVAELIAFLSNGMTLRPGDIICTGTPPGVGQARSPQLFLTGGDEVTVEIEGLGSLSNPFANA